MLIPHLSSFFLPFYPRDFSVDLLKKTKLNQYAIVDSQGVKWLTVPLNNAKLATSWNDLRIDYSKKWIREHENALQTAYGKAPFFEFYTHFVFNPFYEKHEYLVHLIDAIKRSLISAMQISDDEIKKLQMLKATSIDKEYAQLFQDKIGFVSNLSVLDMLFNIGPDVWEFEPLLKLHKP